MRTPPGQLAVIAGVALLVAGGAMIAMAWNGAASLDYVQGQFPYLLSGSIPGLALVIVGVAVLVLAALRRDAAERTAQLDRLRAGVAELTTLIGSGNGHGGGVGGDYRPRSRSAPERQQATRPLPTAGGPQAGR